MNTVITIAVNAFVVTIKDERTGSVSTDTLVLTRGQLRAAHTVGMSSKELIHRIFNRQGYHVLEIGECTKLKIPVDVYANAVESSIVIEGDVRLEAANEG